MTRGTVRFTGRVGDRVHTVRIDRGPGGEVRAEVDGRRYELSVTEPQARTYSILENGVSREAIVRVRRDGATVRVGRALFDVVAERPGSSGAGTAAGLAHRRAGAAGQLTLTAVMPGRVLRVLVAE